MSIIICGIIQVYITLGTVVTEDNLLHAIKMCKEERQSNGCLEIYTKHKDIAKIKCGDVNKEYWGIK